MERKIDAHNGACEEGFFVLPLMHHELAKSFPLIAARIKRRD